MKVEVDYFASQRKALNMISYQQTTFLMTKLLSRFKPTDRKYDEQEDEVPTRPTSD